MIKINPDVTLTNNKIDNFYKQNPQINFEKTNLLFIDLFEKELTKTDDAIPADFQTQIMNFMSIYQSEIGENLLEKVLNKLNPTSEVIKNTDDQLCCNFILKRNNKSTILIESKECDTNIHNIATNCFIETVKLQNTCGIFISQHSGILDKFNFQIEIYNENIVIYI